MIEWIEDAGAGISEYALASLSVGLSLSQTVTDRWSTLKLDFYAVVRQNPGAKRLLSRFDEGGIGRGIIDSDLVIDLCQRFPSGQLILEIPLARRTDPYFEAADNAFAFVDDDVYAWCALSSGPERVQRTLREADPAFAYRAFVLHRDEASSAALNLGQRLASGAIQVQAVIVGAYDGEGLVVGIAR